MLSNTIQLGVPELLQCSYDMIYLPFLPNDFQKDIRLGASREDSRMAAAVDFTYDLTCPLNDLHREPREREWGGGGEREGHQESEREIFANSPALCNCNLRNPNNGRSRPNTKSFLSFEIRLIEKRVSKAQEKRESRDQDEPKAYPRACPDAIIYLHQSIYL